MMAMGMAATTAEETKMAVIKALLTETLYKNGKPENPR
jgi:hypothetical protein